MVSPEYGERPGPGIPVSLRTPRGGLHTVRIDSGEAVTRPLELGSLTQVREEVRDVWLTQWLRDFVYDLRFSLRSFKRSRRSPPPALAHTWDWRHHGDLLACRSGAPERSSVREPDRLVLVDWKGDQVASGFGSHNLMSYPICVDLQQQGRIFEGVLCRAATTVSLSTGGEYRPAAAEIVSGSYFPVLGVGAALGRVLGPDDDRAFGAEPVVVLAYDVWKSQLAGDPNVVGRKVVVNQHPMTVVGVAAAVFRGIDVGEVPSLWIPAAKSSQAIPALAACSTAGLAGCRSLAASDPASRWRRPRRAWRPGSRLCWTRTRAGRAFP